MILLSLLSVFIDRIYRCNGMDVTTVPTALKYYFLKHKIFSRGPEESLYDPLIYYR